MKYTKTEMKNGLVVWLTVVGVMMVVLVGIGWGRVKAVEEESGVVGFDAVGAGVEEWRNYLVEVANKIVERLSWAEERVERSQVVTEVRKRETKREIRKEKDWWEDEKLAVKKERDRGRLRTKLREWRVRWGKTKVRVESMLMEDYLERLGDLLVWLGEVGSRVRGMVERGWSGEVGGDEAGLLLTEFETKLKVAEERFEVGQIKISEARESGVEEVWREGLRSLQESRDYIKYAIQTLKKLWRGQ